MACLALHIAIAKQYLKNNPQESSQDFLMGAYLPDETEDSIKSHFGNDGPFATVKEMYNAKIDIQKCSNSLDITQSLNRAMFLHLVTDFVFYNFIYSEKLEQIKTTQVKSLLYEDYNIITNYIIDKYQITIPKPISHLVTSKEGELSDMFFDYKDIDNFIMFMSKLDLFECKKQIIKNYHKFQDDCLKKIKKHS